MQSHTKFIKIYIYIYIYNYNFLISIPIPLMREALLFNMATTETSHLDSAFLSCYSLVPFFRGTQQQNVPNRIVSETIFLSRCLE